MNAEQRICKRYEMEMAAIAAADRRYYLNSFPSRAERCDYATRRALLEELRVRLYEDLMDIRRFQRCRTFMRGSKSLNSL